MTTYYTYPKALKSVLDGLTLKALLLTDAASYDSGDEFVADLSNEVSGGSYARQSVAGTVSVDADGAYFTPSGSITFPVFTASVQHIVIFNDTGADATSRIWGHIELGSAETVTNRQLKVNFSGTLIEAAG